jgi:peroxiredoxin/uncharacterized membrane protein
MKVRKVAGSLAGRAPLIVSLAVVTTLAGAGIVWLARAQASPVQISTARTPTFDIAVPAFNDEDVLRLTSTLGGMLAGRPASSTSTDDAAIWEAARGLQTGRLSRTQETGVRQVLTDAARRNPASATLAGKIRHMVDTLTIGKVAPNIVGHDLDGAEFKLSDYRGKVVVLMFSGEWCGICRTQYPYERLLLELYKTWPFAIVGVDSDADRDVARQAMSDRGLTYRAWWDGYLPDNTNGPIASSWNVSGWPTVYVIDGAGVIRFVDLRQEDLLKGVRQLLTEQTHAPAPAAHQ